MNRSAALKSLVALSLCLGTSGCAALLDSALSAAQKTFLNAADKNYGTAYHDDLDKLLKTMVAKQEAPAAAPTPASSPDPVPAPVPVAVAAPAALELEVALLRERTIDGRKVLEPIADGDTLLDSYGSNAAGDNIKITFRASVECYVYIVSFDSTALVQPVFPVYSLGETQQPHSNPVQAGRAYTIPEGSEMIQLDSYRGLEHFYFLATRTRRTDLESQLLTFAAYHRSDDPARAAGGEAVAMVPVTTHPGIPRGIKSSKQGVVTGVQSSQGQSAPVNTQVFGPKGDGDILVERWFRHE